MRDSAKAAQEMESAIFPKFCVIDQLLNGDDLSLIPKRLEENEKARKKNDSLTFNPSIRIEETPEGCIRIFTTPGAKHKEPAKRKSTPLGNTRQTMTTVHLEAGRRKKPS